MKQLIIQTNPKSPVSEAYRSIRTNIQFSDLNEDVKTILFTSSVKGEGKTTTVSNVAETLSDTGKRVMLLDCDFRNPGIHKVFNIENEYGLTDILLDKKDYREFVNQVEKEGNFHIITAGNKTTNPSELLASDSMKKFIEELKKDYDYVLLDSPPVLPVTDPTAMSTYIDGVVLMCLSGQTKRDVAKRAIESLEKVDANILGIVLNKVPVNKKKFQDLLYSDNSTESHKIETLPDTPKKNFYQKYMKRAIDFVLSLFSLIVFSPVMIICAVMIKMDSGSPILFRQKRPGLNEEIFEIYKFRTMLNEEDSKGLDDMDRLTKVGKKLRSTSLDELPQLINILKGDMSIVGPRPLMPSYLPYYTKREKIRHTVRPGLTGLAQVSGRNAISWNDKLEADIDYVENISFLGDLSIILKTFGKVFKREGVTLDVENQEQNLAEVRKNDKVY